MDRLCVCREYEGRFTKGFRYAESLEKHDEKVRADAIEEFGNWLSENGYDSACHNIKAWITEYNLRDKRAEKG